MKKTVRLILIVLLISAASVYSQPASWLIGEWYTYGTYNLDKDGVPDDISFVFNIDGTYHSKFYRNIRRNEGLILEQKVDTHLQKGLSLAGNEATGLKMESGFPV